MRVLTVFLVMSLSVTMSCSDEPDEVASDKEVPNRIAFHSYRDGDSEIFVMDAGGSNEIQLTNNTKTDKCPAWSPVE